ncbi:hypothetical protein CA235_18370 [Sphingomonas sp. ABOLF]|uniref:hypothetical protein n=1 Tax=Sphingomonas sp. ABOLF TaxID=1985879 RepID=UPI000F7F1ACE|nr:hypothetical protein [Sphingomonas sp. ABOLF]RSV11636.1 hypothetical protein CA235_18370 [Sphingomonas sp. ABOLF]
MAEDLSPIVRDIGRKCCGDVSAALHRNMQLMETGQEMAQVALYGAAPAMAAAAAAMASVLAADGNARDPEEIADHLWDILRPMVLKGLAEIQEADHG